MPEAPIQVLQGGRLVWVVSLLCNFGGAPGLGVGCIGWPTGRVGREMEDLGATVFVVCSLLVLLCCIRARGPGHTSPLFIPKWPLYRVGVRWRYGQIEGETKEREVRQKEREEEKKHSPSVCRPRKLQEYARKAVLHRAANSSPALPLVSTS